MASLYEQLPGTCGVIRIPSQVWIISRHAQGEYTMCFYVAILPNNAVNGLEVDSVIDCLPYFVIAQRPVTRLEPQKLRRQNRFANGVEAWITSRCGQMIGNFDIL